MAGLKWLPAISCVSVLCLASLTGCDQPNASQKILGISKGRQKGYVEFYCVIPNFPVSEYFSKDVQYDILITHLGEPGYYKKTKVGYLTIVCGKNRRSGHHKVALFPGLHSFSIDIGDAHKTFNVEVKQDMVTPVNIVFSEYSREYTSSADIIEFFLSYSVDSPLTLEEYEAFEVLFQQLKHDNWQIRQYALNVLGDYGDKRALGPILRIFSGKDSKEDRLWEKGRIAVAKIFKRKGQFRKEEFAQALVSDLSSKSNYVRKCATQVLAKLSGARAIEPLHNLASNDPNPEVRKAAERALKEISKQRKK